MARFELQHLMALPRHQPCLNELTLPSHVCSNASKGQRVANMFVYLPHHPRQMAIGAFRHAPEPVGQT